MSRTGTKIKRQGGGDGRRGRGRGRLRLVWRIKSSSRQKAFYQNPKQWGKRGESSCPYRPFKTESLLGNPEFSGKFQAPN